MRGIKSGDNAKIYSVTGNNAFEVEKNDTTQNTTASGTPIPPVDNASKEQQAQSAHQAEQEQPAAKVGSLVIVGDSAMEIHKFNKEGSEKYAKFLNALAKALPDKNVMSMLVPTLIAYTRSDKAKSMTSDEKQTIDFVYSRLQGVKGVDVYSELLKHTDEYIFFRTDHHWTSLGAYYGYCALGNTAGFTSLALDQYKKRSFPGFLGSWYNETRDKRLEAHPDTIEVLIPPGEYSSKINYMNGWGDGKVFYFNQAESSNKYRIFLGGDIPLTKIKGIASGGKRIAILKDSFANAFAPHLVSNYSEILIIDPRRYTGNFIQLIKDFGADDVLILNYVMACEDPEYAQALLEQVR